MKKSYFIARDKNGSLWMYAYRPKLYDDGCWLIPNREHETEYSHLVIENNNYPIVDLFKNLTSNDEPLELVLKDDKKVKGKSYFIVSDDDGNKYIFDKYPLKNEGDGFWELDPEGCCQEIDSDKLFPDLSFNDEPVEMILISGSDNESENPDDETQDEKCGDCFDNILSIKL